MVRSGVYFAKRLTLYLRLTASEDSSVHDCLFLFTHGGCRASWFTEGTMVGVGSGGWPWFVGFQTTTTFRLQLQDQIWCSSVDAGARGRGQAARPVALKQNNISFWLGVMNPLGACYEYQTVVLFQDRVVWRFAAGGVDVFGVILLLIWWRHALVGVGAGSMSRLVRFQHVMLSAHPQAP